MEDISPLRNLHDDYAHELNEWAAGQVRDGTITAEASLHAAVEYLPWGPDQSDHDEPAQIVATFGLVEAEYAAIRRGAGLLDWPQRGVIRVSGADRREFLNRMLTQELSDLTPGSVAEAFRLNRTGRIEDDLVLIERGDDLLIDLDHHQLAATLETLSEFVFAEDVALADATAEFHRIAVHGRRAPEVLAAATDEATVVPQTQRACELNIVGGAVWAARRDLTGEPGFELFVPRDSVERVWTALLKTDEALGEGKRRIRPVGWYAYNIARIEAGTPLFNIDFGPTNLPHETGVLSRRVSFTKGCYPGQEIVARMENLGRPKQQLVGLRVRDDLLPVAGGQIFAVTDDALASPIGTITSSTLSPMLGAAPIAFGMVRTARAKPGDEVLVNAEGERATAVVQELVFWPGPEVTDASDD